MQRISIDSARRIALDAQGFGHVDRTKPTTTARFRRMMDRLHLLQLDAVPVVARTQYLPAYSRLGPYRHAMLDELAYHRDEWFEAWAHEASMLPVSYQPLLRWSYERVNAGQIWRPLWRVATEERGTLRRVLEQVRSDGPLRASELRNPGQRHAVPGWSNRTAGALALDFLFRAGQLGIRRVGNFEKQYDLIENIVPADVLNSPDPCETEALRELLMLAADAYGIATADDLIDYFRLPVKPARRAINELAEAARLVPVAVEGWRTPAYLPRIERAARLRVGAARHRVQALVSPFDPLVWYRKRAERLFHFEYRLEIYTPQKKRRWGYYVLPFLLGNNLVARCDLRFERDRQVLRVPAAYLEAGESPDRVAPALASELQLMQQWLGAQRVVVGRRGPLVGPLRSALRELSTR